MTQSLGWIKAERVSWPAVFVLALVGLAILRAAHWDFDVVPDWFRRHSKIQFWFLFALAVTASIASDLAPGMTAPSYGWLGAHLPVWLAAASYLGLTLGMLAWAHRQMGALEFLVAFAGFVVLPPSFTVLTKGHPGWSTPLGVFMVASLLYWFGWSFVHEHRLIFPKRTQDGRGTF